MNAVRTFTLAAALSAVLLPSAAFAACESGATIQAQRGRANEGAITSLLSDADNALAHGDFEQACAKYRLVLSIDDTNAPARIGLGEGALAEGNVDAARATFQRVVAQGADNARAQQGLGLSFLMGGDFASAEPALRRSVELDPSLWRSWNGLGVIADARADWTASDAAWTGAIAAAPNQAIVHNNKGLSLMQRRQPAAAVQSFDEALRLDPTLNTAANNRRIAIAMTGRYDAALAGVSERDLPAVLNNVAVVASRRGDRAIADRLLAAAITSAPRYYELAARNREAVGAH